MREGENERGSKGILGKRLRVGARKGGSLKKHPCNIANGYISQ